ncbi:MAG: hypothetical protein R3F65_32705 [bacterium]
MSLGEEDGRRLLESHADIRAAKDPPAITDAPTLQSAVAYTAERLADARAALVIAIRENTRELGETADARGAGQKAAALGRNTWRYVRGRIEQHLLNPPPTDLPDPEELARREKLLARIAPQRTSDLGRMSPERVVEHLQALRAALDEEAVQRELHPMGIQPLAESLDRAIDGLMTALGALAREIDEDREATRALTDTRATLDQASTQHAMMIEVALRDAGRVDRIGRFVKGRDAAYRARRRAGRAVADEPGLAGAMDGTGIEPPPPAGEAPAADGASAPESDPG